MSHMSGFIALVLGGPDNRAVAIAMEESYHVLELEGERTRLRHAWFLLKLFGRDNSYLALRLLMPVFCTVFLLQLPFTLSTKNLSIS